MPPPAPPTSPATPSTSPPVWAAWAALLGLALLFAALSLTPVTNNDVWLQMATGDWILENGRVPLEDPFSFSAAGQRFHAHEWLAGIIFTLVYGAGGAAALTLLKTALGGAALAFCIAAARRLGASWAATVGCTLLALIIVNSRFLERPEMFSYLFTALYLLMFTGEERRMRATQGAAPLASLRRPGILLRSSLLWWLVPCHWFWAQVHGYFITGVAMVGTFLLAMLITHLFHRWRAANSPRAALITPRLLAGGIALAAMLLLGLVNPNGLSLYLYPFELAGGDNVFMRTVFEWKPTFTTDLMVGSSMFLAFCLWLGLLAVAGVRHGLPKARPATWRTLSVASLLLLLAVRLRGLQGSAWLLSPAELATGATLSEWALSGLDMVTAPLRLLGAAADDLFTLVFVALAAWLAATWRHPERGAAPALALTLMFLFQQAGSLAPFMLGALVVIPLVLAALRGRLPLWQLALLLVFLLLAVRQNRNIVNFALVTLPVLAAVLSRPAAAAHPSARRSALQLCAWAALSLLLAGGTVVGGWPYTPTIFKKVGLGVGDRIPEGGVKYIRQSGLVGRVFNKYSYGAYIIHQLYPGSLVFMDSRNGVYGEVLYQAYLDTLSSAATAARIFSAYDFDYVFTDYNLYPPASPDPGLLGYLAGNSNWVLVYFDDRSLIYVPRRAANEALIARDGYRVLDPVAYRPDAVAALPPAELETFGAEAARALQIRPLSLAARLMRADYLIASRQPEPALSLLAGIIEEHPRRLFELVKAARLAQHLRHRDQALLYYRHALRLAPHLEALRREMAQLETETGR